MTLFKSKGRKFFSVEFTDIGGKKVRKSTKCESKREAQRVSLTVINKHNEEITNGNSIRSNQDCKLSVLLDQVLKDRWSKCKDTKTIISRLTKINSMYPSLSVSEVNPRFILDLCQRLQSEGIGTTTCNRYMSLIKTALKDARDVYETIKVVPVFKKYKEDNKKERYLERSEENILVDLCHSDKLKDLIVILADTGIRLSACLAIDIHNVDIINQTITIHGVEQKGVKTRTLQMTDRVFEVINRRTEGNTKSLFNGWTKDGASGVYRNLKKKLPDTMKDITLHTLRHTFASRLVQAGVPLYTVQYLLGHSSIITTQRYAHLNNESAIEAMSKLNCQ